jgi:hypothetical protein
MDQAGFEPAGTARTRLVTCTAPPITGARRLVEIKDVVFSSS